MVSITKESQWRGSSCADPSATPTVEVNVPIYEADGRTPKKDKEGREVEFIFTLHRP